MHENGWPDRREEPALVGGGRGTISQLINFTPVDQPRHNGTVPPAGIPTHDGNHQPSDGTGPPAHDGGHRPHEDTVPPVHGGGEAPRDGGGVGWDQERYLQDLFQDGGAGGPGLQGEYGGPPPVGEQAYQGFLVPTAPGHGIAGHRLVRHHDPFQGGTATWHDLVDDSGAVVQTVQVAAPPDHTWPAPPDHADVRGMLHDLATGRRTPEEVAAWATRWVAADGVTVTDTPVWEALVTLSGAALGTPAGRLHGTEDYAAWAYAYDHR